MNLYFIIDLLLKQLFAAWLRMNLLDDFPNSNQEEDEFIENINGLIFD